jgi:peptide/nickel transport system substrate-binding protein
LPVDVLVVEPIESIGKYGGTIFVNATNSNPWSDLQTGAGLADGLFRLAKDQSGPEPNLAKGWEVAKDFTSLTIFLRKGVKWSDGAPMTAEHTLFWFELMRDPQITHWSTIPATAFKQAVKVDEQTVRIEFTSPRPDITAQMALWNSWNWAQPLHYLQKWHLAYNPEAEKIAKEEGFDNWRLAFLAHYWWAPQTDMNLPKFNSFAQTERTTSRLVFQRNPYYWKVDTAGNQLPYIDTIVSNIVDAETYDLKILSGEVDYAYVGTQFANFTLYKQNEKAGNYRVVQMPGASGSEVTIGININYPDQPLRSLFQDARFHQALSLALNREEINESVYFGVGVPRQATVLPSVSYYKPEWGRAFADYNPAQANRLLDQLGLNKRDREGFRIGPDGNTLFMAVEHNMADTRVLELVKEYWEDVGVKTQIVFQEQSLFHEREGNNLHVARVGGTPWADEIANYTQGSRGFAGQGDIIAYANAWGGWNGARIRIEELNAILAETTDAQKKADIQKEIEARRTEMATFAEKIDGEEPPQEYIQLADWFRQRSKTPIGSPEYMDLSRKIFDFHASHVWQIGTVGMIPRLLIVSNRIGNAETPEFINRAVQPFDTTGYFEQLYFKN